MNSLKLKLQQIREELLKGGLADSLSLTDIAKKHNVDISHIKEQFKKGLEVEREHSTNKIIQTEIAKDHLSEDPNYYTKLATIESSILESIKDDAIKHFEKELEERGAEGIDEVKDIVNKFWNDVRHRETDNRKDIKYWTEKGGSFNDLKRYVERFKSGKEIKK